ncbi:Lipoprotein signal peptidase [Borrelia duttonii CR2A]|uniref:Lipoprotein signal peptidase n=5 Tax=Borrelia TaxID=138 RepID=LSPA_BORDL|nr:MULTISPECIES: signal peptidase II [Borrelia]B5RM28.1 RecName: Full=Lipoprotein signal peptidase; AltName: Full=Prolipoprotein signal peptidase; AltName: Full=Signal peptidase II; Short=SPase II [Borrelia duttonii Ly]B5RRS4.1 RecName: Full=Lipoprotein signal peptidase; AltName: Full=Prolipoprotein signal peptidase; AltName: Full=Signal peptidase II; Short=SPase II [Borrelia recurrentis A1]ACH93414.1 signal peptidase II [Borrelia duttonii Ly]ACH94708.1 signal peptidase II [Borrelia recurrentis
MNINRNRLVSNLIFISILVFFDQWSKYLVVTYVRLGTEYLSFFGDLFKIIHVRNTGVLFSLGSNIDSSLKNLFFLIIPIIILVFVFSFSLKENNKVSRFALILILSGGIGNIIDRLFRPLGVVDFLDVKFFGIFGLQRWPTFNFADSYVVVGMIVFIIYDLFTKDKSTNL